MSWCEGVVGLETASVLVGGAGWEQLLSGTKRLETMPARQRSRLRVEARRWIEVGAVVSYCMLAEKGRSAESDLGWGKPLDHLHRSTA